MVTGAIKNKVDKIWDDIAAGGITNPITVIEQLTYLMFIRSLDEKELENEEFANMMGESGDYIFHRQSQGSLCAGANLRIKIQEIFLISYLKGVSCNKENETW